MLCTAVLPLASCNGRPASFHLLLQAGIHSAAAHRMLLGYPAEEQVTSWDRSVGVDVVELLRWPEADRNGALHVHVHIFQADHGADPGRFAVAGAAWQCESRNVAMRVAQEEREWESSILLCAGVLSIVCRAGASGGGGYVLCCVVAPRSCTIAWSFYLLG